MNRFTTGRRGGIASSCALLALLAACGGGGGDASPPPPPPPPPPPAGVTVGGSLAPAANLVVDSDTNDLNQTPLVDNSLLSRAQAIGASSQVMGTVNEAGSGPEGATYTAGDLDDYFTVTVAAGQTVELDFTADPNTNDVDLYVWRGTEIVGQSIGVSSSECVRISEPGTYTVNVFAYAGASIYNLRLTAPGATSSCANATGASLLPGQLIVALPPQSARAANARSQAASAGLRTLRGELAPGRVALMGLPATPRAVLQAAGREPRPGTQAAAVRETVRLAKQLQASGQFAAVTFNRVLKASALVGTFPPDDPRYGLQRWHYEQIALPAAMGTLVALSPQPTRRPIVAVVDTGIVADHPDLATQLVPGFDFIDDLASAGDGDGRDPNPDDLRSDAVSQPSFHGTHVAGTVAAATFDGDGAAGVAPMALIMPLRVLGEGGTGTFFDILQAIRHAAGLSNVSGGLPARPADVINLSLGANGAPCSASDAALFAEVRAQGTVIVAATGNDSDRPNGQRTAVSFPANCAGVIAVGATDAQRGLAPYSNGGPEIALAAPGGDMRRATSGTGLPDGVYSTLATFDGTTRLPTYGMLNGTSMATPHVAGVIALMRWANPALTPSQIDQLIAAGRVSDDAGAAGFDVDYGWGIVNAAKAVQAALEVAGTPPTTDGVVVAQPTVLDFGPTQTTLDFTLLTTGTTTETVTSVTDSSAAVTVAPRSIDNATGLGSYRVTVDRSGLPEGVSTPSVTVTTSARTLTLRLSIEKRAAGTPGGNVGPVYVLVYDAVTNELAGFTTVTAPTAGRYPWRVEGVTATSVVVVAGTDYDNDGFICSRGEACGGYPVLGVNLEPITLSGNRSDLDFLLSPVGAGNVEAAAAAALQKRKPTPRLKSSGSTLNSPTSVPAE